MIDERLIDALNDCIDRMAAGEPVEVCLTRYPDLAADLRPMLEAGLVARRVSYPAVTVETAQGRVRQRLRGLLGPPPLPRVWLFGLVLFSLGLGAVVGSGITVVSRPLPTEGPTVPVIIVTATTADTQTAPPPTATMSPQLTATTVATETTTASPTTAPADTVQITIEGPVTAINGNVVTIFDQPLAFSPEAPALTVLRLGDTIRVRAQQRGEVLLVSSVTFVSVEVVIDSGRAWRDSETCENPPPEWVQAIDGGTAWLLRCAGAPGGGGNAAGSGGRDPGGDDDDDD